MGYQTAADSGQVPPAPAGSRPEGALGQGQRTFLELSEAEPTVGWQEGAQGDWAGSRDLAY